MASTIDAHVHIYEDGRDGGAEKLISEMDRFDIDRALLIAVPQIASNEFIMEVCRQYPDRFSALVCPDIDKQDPCASIDKFLAAETCAGIKVHPREQHVSPCDSRIYGLMDLAKKVDKPVMFDAFLYGRDIDSPMLSLMAIHRVAADHPGVKVIIAHAGGHRLMDALMVAKSNRNVYLDISFIVKYFEGFTLVNDLAPMVKKVGVGRVIYGSDYPAYEIGDYFHAAKEALWSLGRDDLDLVFGGAAAQVYRF